MKEINGCLVNRKFRPIFSPSIVYLLKTLNAFQRAFELDAELTSLDLMNERNGSIIGSMLDERHLLLRQADFNLNCL